MVENYYYNKPILSRYNVLYICKYLIFQSVFWSFSIAKEINQIQKNIVCVAARHIFVYAVHSL